MSKVINVIEGYMPFREFRTYYRIVGNLNSGKAPIVLLHGGPGSTHNYFETLDALAEDDRAVICYDQLGCGNSYLDGHPELWNIQTWDDELVTLINHLNLTEFHLLGQSWGGMLAIEYAIERKSPALKSLILSSTLSDSALWSHEQHRLIGLMNQQEQDAINRATTLNEYSNPEYIAANNHYMTLHCAGEFSESDPECLRRNKRAGTESYLYGWGPNEYTPLGSLRDFNYTNRLNEISVPALIISGTNDLCTPLVAKTMYDAIPDSQWELFDGCRHMCFVEQNVKYLNLLKNWLNSR